MGPQLQNQDEAISALAASLYKSNSFEKGQEDFSNKAEELNASGHRGSSLRAEAWAGLFAACQAMSKGMHGEAVDMFSIALSTFHNLKPSDCIGSKLCEGRLCEAKALVAMKQGSFWDSKKLLVEAKGIYMERKDRFSCHRVAIASALCEGHDYATKGDVCFMHGDFETAFQAFNAACSAYLRSNIHDQDRPDVVDPLANQLRQKILYSVAVCSEKRKKSEELAEILKNAHEGVANAKKKAEEKDFGAACDLMKSSAGLYDLLGMYFEGRAADARDAAESYEIQRLYMSEEKAQDCVRANEYSNAAAIAIQACKHYTALVNAAKKRNSSIAKDARLGHVRASALLLEITGTQSWWVYYNNTGQGQVPFLPFAFPGRLLETGAGGDASEGVKGNVADPGRCLSDTVGLMLYDHQKRLERRGYDHDMLFGEAARLLAVAGNQSSGLRMQYFRWIQNGFVEWGRKNWSVSVQGFSTARDLLPNINFEGDIAPESMEKAALSLNALIEVAEGRKILGRAEEEKEKIKDGVLHMEAGKEALAKLLELLQDSDLKSHVSGAETLLAALNSELDRHTEVLRTMQREEDGEEEEEEVEGEEEGDDDNEQLRYDDDKSDDHNEEEEEEVEKIA